MFLGYLKFGRLKRISGLIFVVEAEIFYEMVKRTKEHLMTTTITDKTATEIIHTTNHIVPVDENEPPLKMQKTSDLHSVVYGGRQPKEIAPSLIHIISPPSDSYN